MRRLLAAGIAAVLVIAAPSCGKDKPFEVGLIIKQQTNPFFREIRATTEQLARRQGLKLDVAFGKSDVDNFSQAIALTTMVRAGAKGIIITPVDPRRIAPAIAQARRSGVTVIAVDTPTEPLTAPDALYATDNLEAGELIGRYARRRAAELGIVPKIAMLDLAPGISVGKLRHEGFLKGFGIAEEDARIAGSVDTEGDQAKARAGMARLLRANPDITVVYTVNEPAAFGAAAALRAAGKASGGLIIVSVDGGCQAIRRGVARGVIDATAQQYPQKMATEAVEAMAAVARGEDKPTGFHDTGVRLIAREPAEGVASRDVAYGLDHCWG